MIFSGQCFLYKEHLSIIIELDYKLVVVHSIVDRNTTQTEFSSITSDCQAFLQQHLNFKISFVNRQINYVAHTLAEASRLHARH